MTDASIPPTLLTDAYVEQFEREGYVVIPGLLTTKELDHYNEVEGITNPGATPRA